MHIVGVFSSKTTNSRWKRAIWTISHQNRLLLDYLAVFLDLESGLAFAASNFSCVFFIRAIAEV